MSDLIKQIEELTLRCDSSTLLPVILQVEQLTKERDELRQQVEELKNGFEGCCYACEPVGEMNKKLLKERDEARRDCCWSEANTRYWNRPTPHEYATLRNWNCFDKKKEETP